jgi:hypothetical protein
MEPSGIFSRSMFASCSCSFIIFSLWISATNSATDGGSVDARALAATARASAATPLAAACRAVSAASSAPCPASSVTL